MQAWVTIARDEIRPQLTDAAKAMLQEFYVDTRQLNSDSDTDTPPVTARKLVTGWRLSAARARVELSNTIKVHHAEWAIKLSKQVVGENFDPETGTFDADRTTEGRTSQQQRVEIIVSCLKQASDPLSVEEISEETGITQDIVENRIDDLYQKGELMEPNTGTFEVV